MIAEGARISLERRALVAGLLATPLFGHSPAATAAAPFPEFDMAVDLSSIDANLAELGKLLEDLAPTGELVDEFDRLLESGTLFVADMETGAAGTGQVSLRLEPSDSLLLLLAALRAGHCDLEFVKSLNHENFPSLDGVATPSKGGEGDGVKSSPFACQMGAA